MVPFAVGDHIGGAHAMVIKVECKVTNNFYFGKTDRCIAAIGFKFLNKGVRDILIKVSLDFRHRAAKRKLRHGRH